MPRRDRGNSFDGRSFGQLPVRKARSFVIKSQPDESSFCQGIKNKSIADADSERGLRESVGASERGRKQFQTVEYNPFQTEAYRSNYSRYIKALNMTPASIVKQDNLTLYAFQSCASPVGYWRVTRADTDIDAYFVGGQCAANYTINLTVYRVGVGNNGTVVGQTYSDTVTVQLLGPIGNPYFGPSITVFGQEALIVNTGNGLVELFGPWDNTEYSSYYFTVNTLVLGSYNNLLMEAGDDLLLEDGSFFYTESLDIGTPTNLRSEDGFYVLTEDGFRLLTEFLDPGGITSDSCGNPPNATLPPNAYRGGQCNIFYDITVRECFTGVVNGCVTSTKRVRGPIGALFFTKNPPVIGAPFMAWFLQAANAGPSGVLQVTGAYNSTIYTSLTCEIISIIVSPPPTNPVNTFDNCGVSKYEPSVKIKESSWSCNCPDKTKKLDADVRSIFQSRRFDRDWSSSDAGATGDCKHIYAAKIAAGIKFAIPTDVPANISMGKKTAAFDPFRSWSR